MNTKEYKQHLLDALHDTYRGCTGCHFNMNPATQIVFGEGNPDTKLLFIGEAPGQEEDKQGLPFVGRSGKLLNKILELAGTSRKEVFITNIVKIRPPNNRRPLPTEIAISKPLLQSQIKIIRPQVICTLGSAALEGLLDKPVQITKMRGIPFKWNGITVIPTYHPAFILRNPKELQTLVDDITQAASIIS